MAAPRQTPLFAPALGVVAAAMAVPMLYALLAGDERVARAFFYAGAFTGFVAAIMGAALAGRRRLSGAQSELVSLLIGWAVLPVFAAIPLALLTPQLGLVGAWFEMVAAFTTTGGTGYADPARVLPAIHLWRGIVAWLGGLLTLTAAYVVLAPRRLGGFEVLTPSERSDGGDRQGGLAGARLVELGAETPALDMRLRRALRTILPVYGGLTATLILLFGAFGDVSLTGVVHALGIVSTSGVSADSGGFAASGVLGIEIVAAVFLVLAASRLLYGGATRVGRQMKPLADPELRLMALIVGLSTLALFARHWFSALTLEGEEAPVEVLSVIWGLVFTTLSYLTTTGYESAAWESARAWAGLENPALILLGLCAIGGGAATTAGGLKLIRAATLYRHGMVEIDHLIEPLAVRGSGASGRGRLQEGAFIAWAFIMLYTVAIFATSLGLTLTGLNFETAQIAAIAAVSNTGPAFGAVAPGHADFSLLDSAQRAVVAAGMILGRVETLAVIAIMRPNAWSLRSA
ncbi:MAG: potassium transporter TrkG [Pseudomonadota bacterium]